MVVEDKPENIDAVARAFEKQPNLDMNYAFDVAGALERLDEADVVLTDLCMGYSGMLFRIPFEFEKGISKDDSEQQVRDKLEAYQNSLLFDERLSASRLKTAFRNTIKMSKLCLNPYILVKITVNGI